MPPELARIAGRTHLKISLRTKEPAHAQFLAAHLDATAAHVFMSADSRLITKGQLTELFRQAFEQHRDKLALMADFNRQEAGFDPAVEAADEQAMGWAYRMIARNGVATEIQEADRHAMTAAGVDAHGIASIARTLAAMQHTGMAKPSPPRLCRGYKGAAI
jgi:hypothetical protein